MKCVILAAGYATRLYPLTENFPKPLLKVGEKTILDWLVDDIAQSGAVDGYVVISNHRYAGHFEAWAKERPEEITGMSRLSPSLGPSITQRATSPPTCWATSMTRVSPATSTVRASRRRGSAPAGKRTSITGPVTAEIVPVRICSFGSGMMLPHK